MKEYSNPVIYINAIAHPMIPGTSGICSCCGAYKVVTASQMNMYNLGVVVGLNLDISSLNKADNKFSYDHVQLGDAVLTVKTRSISS